MKGVHFLSEIFYKRVRVHGPLGKASTQLTAPGVCAKEWAFTPHIRFLRHRSLIMANDNFSHLSVSTRILWWRTVCLKNMYTTMATCRLNPGSIAGGIWHWEMMAEQSLGLKLLQVREQWNFYQEKFDNPLLWLQNTMPYLVVIVIKTFLEKHYGTILAKICFIKKFKKTLKVWNFSRPVTKINNYKEI